MREGRKVRRSLCPTSEASERSHACSTWQGPRSHFSGDRCARHRLVATELRRQLGHSAGRALQLPLPIRDKRFCNGAREARSVDWRQSAQPLRLPQRGSRAPAPIFVERPVEKPHWRTLPRVRRDALRESLNPKRRDINCGLSVHRNRCDDLRGDRRFR